MESLSALVAACTQPTAGLLLAATAVLSYLLGCFNGAVLVSRYALHDDVRRHGSGNAGLTNFLRSFGGKLTFVVLLTDLLKEAVAVLVSRAIFSAVLPGDVPIFVVFWSGLWCIVGHMYPCMFRFRGGKGILCGGMLSILVDWRVAAFVWGFFFVGVLLTRWVSLGSCMGAAAFAISSSLLYPLPSIVIPAVFVSGFMIWKHRANLGRIARGQESKLSFHKKETQP